MIEHNVAKKECCAAFVGANSFAHDFLRVRMNSHLQSFQPGFAE
jgi:hypothetical protein